MIADRDARILAALERARPMLQNIAYHYHVELEDLYQEVALVATLRYERASTANSPERYLQRTIHLVALTYVRNTYQDDTALSLDMPLDQEGSEITFGETIPARTEEPEDHTQTDAHSTSAHKALRRLPLEEQQYLRERFQLNAFDPLPPSWDVKPNYQRSRNAVRKGAYRRLRADQELAASILEVC